MRKKVAIISNKNELCRNAVYSKAIAKHLYAKDCFRMFSMGNYLELAHKIKIPKSITCNG